MEVAADTVGGAELTVIVLDDSDVELDDVVTPNETLVALGGGGRAVKSTSTLSPLATLQLAVNTTVTTDAVTVPVVPAWRHVDAESSTRSIPVGTLPRAVEGVTVTLVPAVEPERAAVAVKVTAKLVEWPTVAVVGVTATLVTPPDGAPMA